MSVAASTVAADPLDKPAFTATPAELLAAGAAAAAPDHDVVVLRDDATFAYDAQGRATRRYHVVLKVLTQAGVDDWATITLDWSPFYEDQPSVRARVIAPDGSVAELDQALVQDAPTVSESPTIFSDRRALTAPLPRLVIGAVVDEEFVLVDREPLLAAGAVRWIGLRRGVPIVKEVVTVTAPTAARLKVATRGPAPPKPVVRTAGGVTTTTFTMAKVAPYDDDDLPGAPADFVPYAVIGITTGASWAAVADGYRALVDPKLAQGATLPPDLIGPTPRATVDRVVAWVHGRVRYTGIELSDSAIVPFAPAETLARGFGDCKDQAALVVSLLRAAKIPADLALLSTGPGVDVDPRLPGLGTFDHAIVRARVDGKDLWIDATEDLLPAGQLPVRDQGRRALIIAPGTTALTTTPVGTPADNLIREVRTYHLREQGYPTVTEVTTQRGVWDGLRRDLRDNAPTAERKQLGKYVDGEYQGTLRSYRSTAPGDVATPLELTIEVDDAKRAGFERTRLWVSVSPADVLDRAPGSFASDDDDSQEAVRGRTVDYQWTWPQVYEIENRFELPPGYLPPTLPATESRALGTMTLTTRRARTGDVYTVTYRLDSGQARITADQLRAGRAAVLALFAEPRSTVEFTLEADRLADDGKTTDAIAAYQRLVALHPGEALHHVQLANLYVTLGMGDAARREARLATTVEPGDGDGWMVLGHMLQLDGMGRVDRTRADRAEARAAFRKALVLMPTHAGAKRELATLLSHDGRGRLSLAPADQREALALRRALVADGATDLDAAIVTSLMVLGDAAGLDELASHAADHDLADEARLDAAGLRGAADVQRVAATLPVARRDAALARATMDAMQLRRYDALRALTTATAPNPTMRDLQARLTEVDLAKLPPAAPTTPMLLGMYRSVAGPMANPPWSPELDARLATADESTMRSGDASWWPSAGLMDLILVVSKPGVTGDARSGWVVDFENGGRHFRGAVELRKGRAFLIGTSETPAAIGHAVLGALAKNDLPTARRWMALAAQLGFGGQPWYDYLARHRGEFASADRTVLALAAHLLTAPLVAPAALPVLRACGGANAGADAFGCRVARLLAGQSGGDVADAAAAARELWPELATDHPHQAVAGKAIALAGDGPGAAALLDQALAAAPDDLELRSARAAVGLLEPWPAGGERLDRNVAEMPDEIRLANDAAWVHLYRDASPAFARMIFERALAHTSEPSHGEINTYAAVLAADGEPALAWQKLSAAIGDGDPFIDDWYVMGRIAEAYGLRDDAITAYRRIPHPTARYLLPTAWDFAQQRLKALGVTP